MKLQDAENTFEEDHTLGILLQKYGEDRTSMCAYKCTHPLEKKVVFKFQCKDESDSPRDVLVSILDAAIADVVETRRLFQAAGKTD